VQEVPMGCALVLDIHGLEPSCLAPYQMVESLTCHIAVARHLMPAMTVTTVKVLGLE